jgi:antitoxin component YwqK of YwqJK toxin-antitoxin module
MKDLITEENKKKLFIPRRLDDRLIRWNNIQPIKNGKRINQYDVETGNPTGIWGEGEIYGGNTLDLFETFFQVFNDSYDIDDKVGMFNGVLNVVIEGFNEALSDDGPLGEHHYDLTIPFNDRRIYDKFLELYNVINSNEINESKKKLFIPRKLSSRYDEWNNSQPMKDGRRINQYTQNGKKDGLWISIVDGVINSEIEWVKGEVSGRYKLYHPNGIVKFDGEMMDSEFIGEWKRYYDNGVLKEIGSYENTKQVGLWKYYYQNNQIESIVTFIDGKPNGLAISYRSDGKILRKDLYKLGEKMAYVIYNQKGDPIESMDWKDEYDNVIKEEMDSEEKIFKSFEVKDNLNPKIWDKDNKIRNNIGETLIAIGQEFYKTLDIEEPIEDIIFTGSLANYNWSEYSDVDLHILIDFKSFDDEELIKKYFDAKKVIWNDNHNIKIKGFDVELYAQDVDEPHESTGIYSLMKNEWIKTPKPQDVTIDKITIKKKVRQFESEYNRINDLYQEGEFNNAKNYLDKLKDKIKEYRKAGLDKGGEMSTENLVFKTLRRSGLMGKIVNLGLNITDKEYTIETMNESEKKKKLFIPRKLRFGDSRYDEWNDKQPIKDGVRINQYTYDGLKTGYWEHYRGNGVLDSKGSYLNGDKDGYWERYWYNGQIKSKGNYVNGEKDGFWEWYYSGGELDSKGMYINGKKYGFWEEYFVNGRLSYKGGYFKGSQTGGSTENITEGKVSDSINEILKNFKKNFGIDVGFLLTFGGGINALVRNVSSLIKNYTIQPLNAFEITNLAIAMIVVYIRKNKSLKGFKDEMLSITAFTTLIPAYSDIVNGLLGNIDFIESLMTLIKSAGVYITLNQFKSK